MSSASESGEPCPCRRPYAAARTAGAIRVSAAAMCGNEMWCLGADSNHRHADFQSAALPTELPRPRPACAGAASIEEAMGEVQPRYDRVFWRLQSSTKSGSGGASSSMDGTA